MSFISAYLLYGLFLFLGILPYKLFYALSDLVGWFVYRVVGYRRKVTEANLQVIQFRDPELKKPTIRRTYKNLADIFLEGVKAFTISGKQAVARHRILNPEILEPYYREGRSMICVTGHYNNWEWGALSAPLQTPYHIVGFYKPIRNKYLDRIVRNSRGRTGTELASIKATSAAFERNAGRPSIYLMAADQSPRNKEKAVWVDFLGRDTAFLHGPEKYASLYNYPVFYADIKRVKRGYYTLNLSILADDPASLNEGEITKRFAAKLESIIREDPGNWLWSHKRWKLSR